MKPIYIKMQAFGSYQEECIFFDRVDHGLFLITGDTGAGKTTIFDAITFALYGKTSGGKRDAKMMRSQYAPLDKKTKVEYKFYYRGSEYTIIRSPEQLNWKKMINENGTEYYRQLSTELPSKVELIMPDGSSFPGSLTKINHKIEEIIGLNVKQFTQIAMLAQGDFIKLLHASSEDRKEIFAKIFDTKIYEAIEQETAKRAKAVNVELVENKTTIARELERVKCIENSRYDEEWNSKKYQKRFSETEKEAFLALVLNICKEAEEKWKQTETERKETTEKISSLEKEIVYAKNIQKLFEDLNKWEDKKRLLEEKSQEIEKFKQKIQMGQRALEVEQDYNELEQRRKEMHQCIERVENLKQWISENLKQSKELKKQAQDAQNKYDNEAPRLYAEKESIFNSLNKYDELAETIERQKSAEEKLKQFISQVENLIQDKENSEANLKKMSEDTKELKENTRNLEALENERKIIENRQKDIEEIIRNSAVLNKTKAELREKEEYYQKTVEKEAIRHKEYEQLYYEFINSQAEVLRAELTEGMSCPVCGNIYHNYKNVKERNEDRENVNDKKLKNEKEIYDKAVWQKETAYRNMLDKKGEKNSIIHVLYAACKKLYNISEKEDFFEIQFENEWKHKIAEENKSILQRLNENSQLQKETVKNNKLIKENEKTIEVLIQTVEKTTNIIEAKNSQIHCLKMEKNTYDIGVEMLKQQLIYTDKDSAIKELKKRQQELQNLKEAADNNKQAFLEFEEEMHKKTGELVSEQENMKRFDARLKKAEICYKESLRKQNFQNTEAFQAVLIKRDEIQNLQKKITDYETELAVADNNQKRLIKETKGKEKSSSICYEKEKSELEKYSKFLDKAVKILFNLASVNKEAYKKACLLYEQREKMHQKAVILKNLDDTVNGRISAKHMNFQTYIQRRYFKRVIDQANKRLYVMSGKQFLLQCRDVENLGAQGYVGLDLDIYSIVNDQTRDVKTLSGGESFMAALSMALGMADIIQNSRGNIHIDTMFIDEGFGSLSEETRNQAVHLLNELSEGKRLVGIISHVSELKSQIETKLVVKKNDKGSSTIWEI